MLTSVTEKANKLVSETNFRQGRFFKTDDELKLAAFAGMFVSCFEEFYPDEAFDLPYRNPCSKRELTENLDVVLSKLRSKLHGQQLSEVEAKQIMSGSIHSIAILIDAYLQLGETRRLKADAGVSGQVLQFLCDESVSTLSAPEVCAVNQINSQPANKYSEDKESLPKSDEIDRNIINHSSYEKPVHNDLFCFSYITLEFSDPVIQKRFENFLATETTFWTVFFTLVMPTCGGALFNFISDVLFLHEYPQDTSSIIIVVLGFMICCSHFYFSFLVLQAISRKDKLVASFSNAYTVHQKSSTIFTPSMDVIKTIAPGPNGSDVDGCPHDTIWKSFAFCITMVISLGFYIVTRSYANDCKRTVLVDSVCILSLPIQTTACLFFLSPGIMLVMPINYKNLLFTELLNKAFVIIAFNFVLANARDNEADLRPLFTDVAAFNVSTSVLCIYGLYYYSFAFVLLWAVCYANVRAFRRHQLAFAHTLGHERRQLINSGVWLFE